MSDPELIYFGHVDGNGSLHLPRKRMIKEIQSLAGREVEVIIRRKRKRRSLPQNNWYWGVCVPAILHAFRDWSPDTGWNAEMVHEVLKQRFLPLIREWEEVAIPDTGEMVSVPMTTRKLTTTEFQDYKALVQQWAAEMGIIVPDPNEQVEFAF